ncbi:hypothetical protein [Thalassotalea eurytherma]|uniref:TMhelix containing protein n=1 Tax=Thalassotalea eurytherma TaxID=1144278 RepID=A0ABQ6GY77_9GAMM|nr:hypothetical protein [Thalassotalea eurytherma]GLX80888.1 hypothetical protein theurythT_03400 [Thalassotalea eurytherma]
MFGNLTSLTGGGGMSASSGVSGDDGGHFGDFGYKTSVNDNQSNMLAIGAVVVVALFFFAKK